VAVLFLALIVIIFCAVLVYALVGLESTSAQQKTTIVPKSGSDIITGNSVSAQVWQSLYVTPTVGSPYWVEPGSTYSTLAIYGSQSGSGNDFTEVSRLQNEIDISPTLAGQIVSSWQLSAQSTMSITDMNGNTVGYLTNSQTVNANGNTLTEGAHNWATGASVTGAQLQSLLLTAGARVGNQYYLVITLSNIQLTLNFQDGGYQTLSTAMVDDTNTASWLIKIT